MNLYLRKSSINPLWVTPMIARFLGYANKVSGQSKKPLILSTVKSNSDVVGGFMLKTYFFKGLKSDRCETNRRNSFIDKSSTFLLASSRNSLASDVLNCSIKT